jgi:uncharacterized protein (TIGR03435 family)
MNQSLVSLLEAPRMRKLLRIFLFTSVAITLAAGPVTAQSPAAPAAFEVATIKPAAPLDPAAMAAAMREGRRPRLGALVEGERADYRYMSLRDLVAYAYRVQAYQVDGPDWMAQQRFDIVATLPAGSTKEDAPAMLKQLLAERFKLTVHQATQERSVLGLVVGKSGPKMKQAPPTEPIDENTPLQPGEMKMDSIDGPMRVKINSDGSQTMNMGANGVMTQKMDGANQSMKFEASSISMEGFAKMMNRLMSAGGTSSKQVVDMTGLKGNYSLSFELSLAELMAIAQNSGLNIPRQGPAPDPAAVASASDPVGGSSIYESVQALGLKLESRTAPVLKLVVDHAEKTPTEN